MQVAGLEALLAVARHGSVSRAAEGLFLTQPALTARLQKLEQEVGSPLFQRTPRGMRLTDAGTALMPHAQRALDAIEAGRHAIDAVVLGTGGELAIGAAPAVSTYVLPEILRRFTTERPEVRLSVRTGHSEEIVELVLDGAVHLGIVRGLRHPELEQLPVYDDELVLVVHPSHPFAIDAFIRIEQLGHEDLILFDRTSSFHELTSALFRQAGVQPRGVMELDNIEAAKKMVQLGLGVSLLPSSSVVSEVHAGTLCAVEVAGANRVWRQVVAIRRADAGAPSGAVETFLSMLLDHGERLAAAGE